MSHRRRSVIVAAAAALSLPAASARAAVWGRLAYGQLYTYDDANGNPHSFNWPNNNNWSQQAVWTVDPTGVPVLLEPSNWSTQTYPGYNGVPDNADLPSGSSVNLNVDPTILNLSLGAGATLAIPNNRSLTVTAGSIANDGVIQMTQGYFTNPRIVITNDTALSGSGQVAMNGGLLLSSTGSQRLTVGAGQTVAGSGSLGNYPGSPGIRVTNNGLFDANLQGATLAVESGHDANVNAAVMQASNGGTLAINSGVWSNAGATMQALAGSTVAFNQGASVTGGTIQAVGAGSQIAIGNSSLTEVTLVGSAPMPPWAQTTFNGTITNNAAISLPAGGYNLTVIHASGSVTLAGTGSVTLTDTSDAIVGNGNAAADTLTLGPGQTVQGPGYLGGGTLGIVNNGLIDSHAGSGTLTVQSSALGLTNNGTLRASGGNTLLVVSTAVNNASGVIEALDGSTASTNNSTVTGGTVRSTGTGQFVTGGTTFSGVTFEGQIVCGRWSYNYFTGGAVTNNGTITSDAGGYNPTVLEVVGDLALNGTGTVQLTDGTNAIIGQAGSEKLTIGGSQSVVGNGYFGGGQLAVVNNGLVDANRNGGTLTVQPNAAGFTNHATLQASNGGTLVLQSGTFYNAGGVIQSQAGATVNVSSSTVVGGTVQSLGATPVAMNNATFSNTTLAGKFVGGTWTGTHFTGGLITNNADISFNAGGYNPTYLAISGDLTIGGTGAIHLNGYNLIVSDHGNDHLTLGPGQTVDGNGQIGDGNLVLTNYGSIIASTPGANLAILPSAGGLTNAGLLRASAGTELHIQSGAAYTQTAGETNANGVVYCESGGVFHLNGGKLTGSGTVIAGAVLASSASIAPGNSIGTLHVTGPVTLGDGASLDIELGSAGACDLLAINGNLDLSSLLDSLHLLQTPGTTFAGPYTIATYTGTLTGTFDDVTPGYTVSYATPHQILLTAGLAPEPASLGLLAGVGLLARRRRRA